MKKMLIKIQYLKTNIENIKKILDQSQLWIKMPTTFFGF